MNREGPFDPALARLQQQVREAVAARTPLRIVGGDTKRHLRGSADAEALCMSAYRGITDYTPAELVVVARAGTPLAEIEDALSERGQRLAFEPPRTGDGATLGGMLGAGLAGPSRPWTAAVRDHVLGVTMLGNDGELLRYGGQVMKNVAGYDVPRLVVGAWGTLGPVVEVALRVVPSPAVSRCFGWVCPLEEARAWTRRTGLRPWPITGLCHDGAALHLRLEGAGSAVQAAVAALPGDAREEPPVFFEQLRDWELEFFHAPGVLWRCTVPANAETGKLAGDMLWDWGGALRWLRTTGLAAGVPTAAASVGGTARTFDSGFAGATPVTVLRQALETRVRFAFDPVGVFSGNAAVTGD